MRFNGQDSGTSERKITLSDLRPAWPWRAPVPVTAPAPRLFLSPAGGEVDAALSPIRTDDTVDGVSNDRRTLTWSAENLAPASGVQGERWGQAFLLTAGDGWHPIQVERIAAGELVLAHPLPRNVVVTPAEPATVQWRHHVVQVPAGLPASETSATGAIRWRVEYTALGPAGLGDIAGQRDDGLLHIVERIFSPRVDIARLSAPGLVGRRPTDRDSWEAEIDAAHADLVQHIRSHFGGARREDALDGGRFVWPLLRLTTSRILEASDPEESTRQAREAYRLADSALRTPALVQPGPSIDGEGGVSMSSVGFFVNPGTSEGYEEPDF